MALKPDLSKSVTQKMRNTVTIYKNLEADATDMSFSTEKVSDKAASNVNLIKREV